MQVKYNTLEQSNMWKSYQRIFNLFEGKHLYLKNKYKNNGQTLMFLSTQIIEIG